MIESAERERIASKCVRIAQLAAIGACRARRSEWENHPGDENV
jgi:hypothetical protein